MSDKLNHKQLNLKKRNIRRLNNNKGLSIIMVIVVMLVISILSVGIVRLSYSERLQTIEDNKAVQAQLNSDAGVQIMKAFVDQYPETFKAKVEDQFNDSVSPKPFPFTTNLDEGSFVTELVEENGMRQLKVTGQYKDKSKSVRVELKREETTPDYLFPKFLTLTSELPDYTPVVVPATSRIEPDISVPYWYYYYGWRHVTSKTYDFTSDSPVYFSQIDVTDSSDLKFDLHGKDRVMVVNRLSIGRGSSFSIINNNASQNMLIMYVTDQATLQSEFLNAHENLLIVLKKNARVYFDTQKLDGSRGTFNAYVYAPEGKVSLGGPGTFVSGAIITETAVNTTGYEGGEYVPPTRLSIYESLMSYPTTYSYQLGTTYDN